MSCCISPGTARASARSRVSLTTIRPIGLSSRTTSPTSVIHDVDVMPANSMRTRNAGTGRPAARTTSRASTSTVMDEFRSVAGSKTGTVEGGPGAEARRGQPAGEVQGEGRRLGQVAGLGPRARRGLRRELADAGPVAQAPLTSTAPVPGSSENEKDRSANALSTRATVRMRAAVEAPSSVIWMLAVLLELVAVAGGDGLRHREADLLPAVVDALPLRGGAVARQVAGQGDGARPAGTSGGGGSPSGGPRRRARAARAAGRRSGGPGAGTSRPDPRGRGHGGII